MAAIPVPAAHGSNRRDAPRETRTAATGRVPWILDGGEDLGALVLVEPERVG